MARRLRASWGRRTFEYVVTQEARRDLAITVFPDGNVEVRAPDSKPFDLVVKRVHARRSWIARQLRAFDECAQMPAPQFAPAESFWYLGRHLRLRIERDEQRGVSVRSGRIVVGISAPGGRRAVQSALLGWYRERASEVFAARAARLQSEIALLGGLEWQLRVRRMARRWGSCSPHGTITLNPELLQAPAACVDYVLVHELVHLLEPRHSPRFYRLLTRAMPDWERRRARLARAEVRPLGSPVGKLPAA